MVSPVVFFRGWPNLELGEVDKIDPGRVPHIKPRAKPLPAGLQPFYPEKVAAAPRNDGGGTTLCHFLGRVRVVRIRNNLFPECKEFGSEVDRGPKTDIALGESSERREDENGVIDVTIKF